MPGPFEAKESGKWCDHSYKILKPDQISCRNSCPYKAPYEASLWNSKPGLSTWAPWGQGMTSMTFSTCSRPKTPKGCSSAFIQSGPHRGEGIRTVLMDHLPPLDYCSAECACAYSRLSMLRLAESKATTVSLASVRCGVFYFWFVGSVWIVAFAQLAMQDWSHQLDRVLDLLPPGGGNCLSQKLKLCKAKERPHLLALQSNLL